MSTYIRVSMQFIEEPPGGKEVRVSDKHGVKLLVYSDTVEVMANFAGETLRKTICDALPDFMEAKRS